jgi:hypothetical protein
LKNGPNRKKKEEGNECRQNKRGSIERSCHVAMEMDMKEEKKST